MDTSEQYTKKCDCPEIQEGHRWRAGDYGYWPANGDINVMYCGEYMPEELGEGHIWLPLQHQLQEMVYPLSRDIQGQVWDLYAFATENRAKFPRVSSMEQLWLAFVMKEKYNKIWNGTEWVLV